MTLINLQTGFTNQNDDKLSVQFTYPAVNITSTNYTFYLPNSGIGSNFSYTDNVTANSNKYISGTTTKGYIQTKQHNYNNDNIKNELILEHITTGGDKFYVVIPLLSGKDTSSLDKLKPSGTSLLFDLNSDITRQDKIYHYLSSTMHVFVFNNPINVKSQQFNTGIGTGSIILAPTAQKYQITTNTKIEDEIVCDSPVDDTKKTTTDTTSFWSLIMFLINSMIIIGCLIFISHYQATHKQLLTYFLIIGSIIIFIVCLGLAIGYGNTSSIYDKTSHKYLSASRSAIVFGSLAFTSVVICILGYMVNLGVFEKTVVASATDTSATPPAT